MLHAYIAYVRLYTLYTQTHTKRCLTLSLPYRAIIR